MRTDPIRKIRRRENIATIYPNNIVTVGLNIYSSWCRLPYHGHAKGCSAFENCKNSFYKTNTYSKIFDVNAIAWCIWEKFDLKSHAEKMHCLHPEWSTRMCRNLLYWQGSIRKKRNETVKKFFEKKNLWKKYACVTRGFGINVYATMKNIGIYIEPIKNIQSVKSICFICKYIDDDPNRKNLMIY